MWLRYCHNLMKLSVLGFTLMMMPAIFPSSGQCDQIRLTLQSGETVEGELVEEDGESIRLKVVGLEMTYWKDEVKEMVNLSVPLPPEPDVPLEKTVPDEYVAAVTTELIGGLDAYSMEQIRLKIVDAVDLLESFLRGSPPEKVRVLNAIQSLKALEEIINSYQE